MRTRALARFVRVPPRKAQRVLDQIRGRPAGDALSVLREMPLAAARLIEKVLRSALSNAEHNHRVRDLDELRIVEAVADTGPSTKRVQPRAMGRAFFIRHRTSHLRISVSDEGAAAGRAAARRPGARAGRRPEPTPAKGADR